MTNKSYHSLSNKRDVSQELRDLRSALLSEAIRAVRIAQHNFATLAVAYSRDEREAATQTRFAQFSADLAHEAVRHLEVRP